MERYYFEVGYPYGISTEIEYPDREVRLPIIIIKRIKSLYIRCQIGTSVYILSTRTGFEKKSKPYSTFKFLLGVYSI